MPYYSDTPPDEEIDPNAQEDDYLSGTPFLSQDQAMARNDLLSPALPQAAAPLTTVGTGEASREYRTGRPGLFVQGGAGVPAGMLEVNGQLERSQAAPQPVPWWITQADEFKEQRRQEDLLTRLMQASQSQGERQGGMAIERAQRLRAQLAIDADVKKGIPLRDAMAAHASDLFGQHVTPMTRLAINAAPKQQFSPTEVTLPSGQRVTQVGPNKYAFNRQTKAGGVSNETKFRIYQAQLNAIEKARGQPGIIRDKAKQEQFDKDEKAVTDKMNALAEDQPSSPPSPMAGLGKQPTSQAAILANQLSALHPDWTKPQVDAEVRKHFTSK